jgi:dolichol-phosphate mannosyltransferase
VYNEAGNIGPLIAEAFKALDEAVLGEVIVVDDGSDDGTRAEVQAQLAKYAALRYIRHKHRCGQSASIRTGALAARYPIIATIDGDGQNDPADVPRLYEHFLDEPGSEPAMVAGLRKNRKGPGSRKVASRFANWIRDWVLADDCPDTGCGLKLYWRETYLELPYFCTMHRFLPALFLTYGHEITYLEVNDRPRLQGQSKYTNFSRALIGLYDLVGVSWLRRRSVLGLVAEDTSARPQLDKGTKVRSD